MPKHVTQGDVARRAGVSRSTVSNIITGRVGGSVRITEETRQRVLAAVEELNYYPHAGARSLRSGHTGLLGLLIPDASNPCYWAVYRGVEEIAREHGYQVILSVSNLDLERERACLFALGQQRMDGLILLMTHYRRLKAELEALRAQKLAIVAFGGLLPDIDTVLQSYNLAATELMSHLLGLGHRRIGFLFGAAEPAIGFDRLSPYKAALSSVGTPAPDEWVVYCGGTIEEGVAAAHKLLSLDPRPTAIMAINDLMAIATLQAAAQRGLCVPRDLSVVGFDDIDMAARVVPPLTTVRVDSTEMGRLAVHLMLRRFSQPEADPEYIDTPAQVVLRESTGPCPQEPVR